MRFAGLIIAVVIAAIAAFAVLKMSGNKQPEPTQAQPAQQVESVNIYIAAKAIPIGTTITDEMIGVQPWPKHLLVEGFVLADGKTNPVGNLARAQFQTNEPLMRSKIANPNDPSFLSGDLPAGMRIISIPITETDGVAGFVFPGDHVDLIFTHDVETIGKDVQSSTNASDDGNHWQNSTATRRSNVTITDTLLTNVKVVAVDQRSSSEGSTDKNGKLIVPRSASLVVSQADAQRIRLAQKTGTITMVLRAISDRETSDPMVVTTPADLTQFKKNELELGTPDTIKIYRGAPSTNKDSVSSGVQTTRGAFGGVGQEKTGGPVTLPQGSNIVNPASLAM